MAQTPQNIAQEAIILPYFGGPGRAHGGFFQLWDGRAFLRLRI